MFGRQQWVPLTGATTGALCLLVACTSGVERAARPLSATDVWSRPADSGATGVIYATLQNTDTTTLIIDSLSSPDADRATLHETMQMDGMVHMMPRAAVEIPRNSAITLRAGGLHVMLTDLRRPLRAGDAVSLTVFLRNRAPLALQSQVRAP